MAPTWPPEVPNTFYTPPGPPQDLPRRLQDNSLRNQDAPKALQEPPRRLQETPRTLQRSLPSLQQLPCNIKPHGLHVASVGSAKRKQFQFSHAAPIAIPSLRAPER